MFALHTIDYDTASTFMTNYTVTTAQFISKSRNASKTHAATGMFYSIGSQLKLF